MTATEIPHREDKNPVPVPTEEAIESINNFRRRMVILLTDEFGAQLGVGELAEAIAAIENDCAIQALDAQQRKRVYIALIQNHLGKLDTHGIIHYEERQKVVVPTQATTRLAEVVRTLNELCDC